MISVARCTHNGTQCVREQVESILNQCCPVDEIVISDEALQSAREARVIW